MSDELSHSAAAVAWLLEAPEPWVVYNTLRDLVGAAEVALMQKAPTGAFSFNLV
jgi:hypothetical protein